ncbi:MAG TPA: hypothetical protein VN700_06405 [Vicinamibacterales bacterium]|nr:hypothetical protein [Vicinamibacterales bacterium]
MNISRYGTTAGIAAAFALVIASGCAAPSADSTSAKPPETGVNCDKVTALKSDMRKLWTDHVVWTRVYVMEAVADQPGAQAAATRLMKNQEDIGDAVGKFYGAAADDKLTALLKEHISIAVDIVKAAKSGDNARQVAAEGTWEQNADQIAGLLSGANPNWPEATLKSFLREHLATTRDEVVARLGKKWDADVTAFDKVYDHMLKVADALSDGIVKQFPDKFN